MYGLVNQSKNLKIGPKADWKQRFQNWSTVLLLSGPVKRPAAEFWSSCSRLIVFLTLEKRALQLSILDVLKA